MAAIDESGFLELQVRALHAARVADLPLHHTDPFDRLLVAQAQSEPLHLLTADAALTRYGELVMLDV
jgi:PIN domain nuclease of toxin-antitoxin system